MTVYNLYENDNYFHLKKIVGNNFPNVQPLYSQVTFTITMFKHGLRSASLTEISSKQNKIVPPYAGRNVIDVAQRHFDFSTYLTPALNY